MIWSLSFLLIMLWGNAYFAAALFFAAGLHIYVSSLGLSIGVAQSLVLIAVAAAVPLTAYITGILLDRFSLSEVGGTSFRTAGLALACWLVFSSNAVFDYFVLLGGVLPTLDPRMALTLLSVVVSSVCLCAGLTALIFMLLHVAIELPLRWVQSAARVQVDCGFAAARPLIIIAGLASGFYLITGFFAAELAPGVLLGVG